jgi:hypothetical protein
VKHAISDPTQAGLHDDYEFREWLESVSASQDELKTLIDHPGYSLYQAKKHVRERRMVSQPKSAVWKLLSQFQDRHRLGLKQLMKTFAGIGHHSHLRGHHDISG